MAKKTKKKSTQSDNIFVKVLQGRILSYKFFLRYAVPIGGILLFFLVLIASKFHNQSQKGEIARLRAEMNYLKTEYVRVCGEYNSQIRETEMQERIDSLHINLSVPDQPPFKLE